MPRQRSLEARLIGVSVLWIAFALGIAAVMLSGLYREHVEREHAERIGGYLEELAAALDVAPDGSLQLQRDLSDPLGSSGTEGCSRPAGFALGGALLTAESGAISKMRGVFMTITSVSEDKPPY